MRPLLLTTLLVLAACDTTAPSGPDALVGRWTATDVTMSEWAVSRIDQPVPDLSGPAEGALVTTGAIERTLAFVTTARRSNARIAGRRSDPSSQPNPYLTLTMGPWTSEARLDLDYDIRGYSDTYSAVFSAGTPLFTYADGLLTVPEITLVRDGGMGEQVRVGGTLEVPVLQLRAGVETLTRTTMHPPGAVHAFVFHSDGAVVREYLDQTETGRWEATGTGEGTMTFDDLTVRFGFAIEDGTLRLTYDTEAERLDLVEDRLFAEPGSIVAARSLSVHAYRSGR